ncbi:hypothetical protein AB0B44_41905, partial [Streptomyces sp. NPDC041003]
PRIPHRIDGELLRYAARFGLLAHKDDQIDEHPRPLVGQAPGAVPGGHDRALRPPLRGRGHAQS